MPKQKTRKVIQRSQNGNGSITLNVNVLGYLWKVLLGVLVIGGYIWYQAQWQATVDGRLDVLHDDVAEIDEHLKELDRYFYHPGGPQ